MTTLQVLIAYLLPWNILCFAFAINGSLEDSQVWDSEKSEIVVFVSASSGRDVVNCGLEDKPCRSITYGLQRALASHMSATFINVLPGVYKPEAVRIDCSSSLLQSLVIQGLGSHVYIGLTADIIKCDATFININWTNTHLQPVLINIIISNFSLINCTISNIGFSLLSSGSNIELENSVVSNCTGWQPLLPIIATTALTAFPNKLVFKMSTFSYNKAPLLSTKGMTTSVLQHCNFVSNSITKGLALITLDETPSLVGYSSFTRNIGTNIKMSGRSSVNITQTIFKFNNVLDGTLLDLGESVTLKATGCSFLKSYGTSEGPVVKINQGVSDVAFMSCHFNCNQVNDSIHVPPIKNFAKAVHCTNCTTDQHCLVFCGGGEYLVDGIMCSLCPSGSYNPANQYVNMTALACKTCEPGYYNPHPGRDSCMPCKEGSFAAKSGSTKCSSCKNDFMTSSRGEASCSKWTIGFIVFTACVVLLIVLPLLILLIQHLQTRKGWTDTKQNNFTRLYDHPIQS